MNRNIFGPYWNGAAKVCGDPLRIHRRLVNELKGQHRETLQQSRDPNNEVAFPAIERLIAAVRVAFEMAEWDAAAGTGATESDCMDAFDAFMDWQAKKNETAATSPTLPASSAGNSSATATASSPATSLPSASG